MIALISFPLMLGLTALAAPFVLTLFGAAWTPVIPLLMILAPLGAVVYFAGSWAINRALLLEVISILRGKG